MTNVAMPLAGMTAHHPWCHHESHALNAALFADPEGEPCVSLLEEIGGAGIWITIDHGERVVVLDGLGSGALAPERATAIGTALIAAAAKASIE